MKRRLAPLILAIPLFLAGCADNTGDSEQASTPEAAPAEASTTSATSEPEIIDVGETVTGICTGVNDCDMNLTITSLTTSDTCTPWDDMWADQTREEDEIFLDVEAEVEVIDAEYDLESMTMGSPEVLLDDGFTASAPEAYYCDNKSRESWGTVIDEGEKRRIARIFRIPENSVYMELGGVRWEIPPIESQAQSISTSVATETTSAAVTEDPYIVECLFGTPGPSLMSDGTTIYTDYCFNALGGPAYLEQESQSGFQDDPSNIPFADGGTCPAYKCGYGTNDQGQPNPSSGEIQTLHGCQEGYITDAELCGAVAWVEDHQY